VLFAQQFSERVQRRSDIFALARGALSQPLTQSCSDCLGCDLYCFFVWFLRCLLYFFTGCSALAGYVVSAVYPPLIATMHAFCEALANAKGAAMNALGIVTAALGEKDYGSERND